MSYTDAEVKGEFVAQCREPEDVELYCSFQYRELDEQALAAAGTLTYGSNVKEVTTQVSEGTVDCGIIYETDAYSAGLTVVDAAGPEMCGRAVYPAAILAGGRNLDGAGDFLDFLRTDQAAEVFSRVGFTPLR